MAQAEVAHAQVAVETVRRSLPTRYNDDVSFPVENSFAQGKLQEALAHHTQAHAQGVQTQVEALAASIAHESRRADAGDAMTREAMKSLSDTTASQIAGLPKPDPTAIQQSLERMRIEAAAARAQPILLHDGSSDQQLEK